MYKSIITVMLIGLTLNHIGAQADVIKNYMDAMEENGFSGALLVARDGKVIRKAGYGMADAAANIKNTPSTVFTTGSITKQFTGAAILKLEMMGKLKVTDLMTKYIDKVPSDKKNISLHHLLTHAAGFPGAIGDDQELISKKDFLDRAMSTKLSSLPGEKYRYSNVGYSILAIIVEKVSGMTYEGFLQEYFFRPSGMTHTGYVLAPATKKLEAKGYEISGKEWGRLSEKNWGPEGPGWHLKGNGGVLSTVEDMYKWHQALLGDKILSEAAKKKYYTRHIEEGDGNGTYYGYGWAIFPTPRNTDLITHNGGNGIFFADFLRYLEEDITIMIMTNSARRSFEEIPFNIASVLLKPGFVPEVKEGGNDMSEAEEQIIESIAREFFRIIGSSEKEDWQKFIKEHTTKDFQEMADMSFHLEMFGKMHESLSETQPQDAEINGEELIITMVNGLQVMLGFETNKDGRYLVSGINVN
jgi:CubicO group peptidase (beta-lactamase class C family)